MEGDRASFMYNSAVTQINVQFEAPDDLLPMKEFSVTYV